MIISLDRDTYIRPHRHAGKSESFHIIDGELTVVLFDDDGRVTQTIEMGPYHTGMAFYYRLMHATFHSVLVNSAQVIFHETTNGPFDPADTEYPEWAPPEGDPAVSRYLERLREEVAA
jgi:cupin fold WbuC family metalloprotein